MAHRRRTSTSSRPCSARPGSIPRRSAADQLRDHVHRAPSAPGSRPDAGRRRGRSPTPTGRSMPSPATTCPRATPAPAVSHGGWVASRNNLRRCTSRCRLTSPPTSRASSAGWPTPTRPAAPAICGRSSAASTTRTTWTEPGVRHLASDRAGGRHLPHRAAARPVGALRPRHRSDRGDQPVVRPERGRRLREARHPARVGARTIGARTATSLGRTRCVARPADRPRSAFHHRHEDSASCSDAPDCTPTTPRRSTSISRVGGRS